MVRPDLKKPRTGARSPAGEAQAAEAAWQALGRAAGLDELAAPWLAILLRQSGAVAGGVYRHRADNPGWPEVVAEVPADASPGLRATAARAARAGHPVTDRPADDTTTAHLAHPLKVDGEVVGAVALSVADIGPQRLRAGSRALAWGLGLLHERLLLDRASGRESQLRAMRAAHEAVAAAHDDHRFRAAALGTVTRLAQLSWSDRVTLGFYRDGRSHLAAVSHSAEFGKRLTLSRHIAAAMDEAIEQRAALSHPAPAGEINVTRQQGLLSTEHGPSAVLTVPFRVAERFAGALTFERPATRPFAPDEIALLDFVASIAGPTLWEKRQNDKALPFKVADTLKNQATALLGPGHAVRKITVLALVGLVALFALWEAPYRPASDARVEGAVERSLIAPFDGFIREAPVRAGDRVAEGALIAALDDRDLALERLRLMTEARQKDLELGRAIGEQNRAEAEIIRTQIAQAEAQIELIDARLARARITAPFDGVIVSGDQSQNIGGAVTRGDQLFEIAPAGNYRVVLMVEESRIGDIQPGQTGELVVTSLPNTPFPIVIEKLTPVAVPADGRNTFRTEARLAGSADGLGPGMEGVAKIDVDRRLVIEIWTRSFVDWLRLTLWTWFG